MLAADCDQQVELLSEQASQLRQYEESFLQNYRRVHRLQTRFVEVQQQQQEVDALLKTVDEQQQQCLRHLTYLEQVLDRLPMSTPPTVLQQQYQQQLLSTFTVAEQMARDLEKLERLIRSSKDQLSSHQQQSPDEVWKSLFFTPLPQDSLFLLFLKTQAILAALTNQQRVLMVLDTELKALETKMSA